jgi:deazaflavin-dependent oxidoreductase (nitroreductase family)
LLGCLIVEVISDVIFLIVWRSRWQPGIDALRWFNKRVQNPVMLRLAGKRNRELAALHHTGRESGRQYVTPVTAQRAGQSFLIPLPYGTNVDWCRNVLAYGGCAIDHQGVRYATVAPAIVPADEAAPNLARWRKWFALMGVESYLRLSIGQTERPVEQAS